jgi:hypothetical protein
MVGNDAAMLSAAQDEVNKKTQAFAASICPVKR